MFKRLLFFVTSICLLASCATQQHGISESAKAYLRESAQTQGVQKQQYQLMAIKQLLVNDNLVDAQRVLQQLNQVSLNPAIFQQKLILEAKLALKYNRIKSAIGILKKVNPQSLNPETKQAYYLALIESYTRNNQLAEATIARIRCECSAPVFDVLSSDSYGLTAQQEQSVIIWQDLQQLSLLKLNQLSHQYSSNLIQGWLRLAILSKRYANQSKMLVNAVQDWKHQYPNHPANAVLPDDQQLQNFNQKSDDNTARKTIVLLLPLQGSFAKVGQAIRDGFITAFYQKYATPDFSNINVKVQDITGLDVCNVYQQVEQSSAQFIVGPLTKANVSKLSECFDGKIPVLALNYLPGNPDVANNFVQFGLSPVQAAKQSAQYAWQHGVSRIITISPKSDWGQRVISAFSNIWIQQGGKLIASYQFSQGDSYRQKIANLLNIDQSQSRIDHLKSIFRISFKSLLRRRHDIDGVFLVTNPYQGREMHPFLNFYYAGNLPIFSISDIYQGYDNRMQDQDLDSIYFNDMPWVLTHQYSHLKQQLNQLWSKNFRVNKRMYGVGIDAYLLMTHWQRLLMFPNFALYGVTGQLYLNQQHQIYHQLNWAQFQQGIPVLKDKI